MNTSDERNDIDTVTASRLLNDADVMKRRAIGGVDHRTESSIAGWTAAAMFVYVVTVLLVFTAPVGAGSVEGHDGVSYVSILLLPFLTMTQLVKGARDRLPIATFGQFPTPKIIITMLGLVPFITVLLLSFMLFEFQPWVFVAVGIVAAAPLAVSSVQSARRAGISASVSAPPSLSTAPPLTLTSRRITVALGLAFGIAGVVTPYRWSPLVLLILMLALVVLIAAFSSRWGLPSVGSEWGRRHWLSFGASFTLLFALTVVSARTPWNGPALAALVGVLVAAPLVASSFVPGRRQ